MGIRRFTSFDYNMLDNLLLQQSPVKCLHNASISFPNSITAYSLKSYKVLKSKYVSLTEDN